MSHTSSWKNDTTRWGRADTTQFTDTKANCWLPKAIIFLVIKLNQQIKLWLITGLKVSPLDKVWNYTKYAAVLTEEVTSKVIESLQLMVRNWPEKKRYNNDFFFIINMILTFSLSFLILDPPRPIIAPASYWLQLVL